MTTIERDEVLALLRKELRAARAKLPHELEEHAEFKRDLGLDSLDIVDFVARVELAYHVTVSDDEWQGLSTLAKVADYVLERLDA